MLYKEFFILMVTVSINHLSKTAFITKNIILLPLISTGINRRRLLLLSDHSRSQSELRLTVISWRTISFYQSPTLFSSRSVAVECAQLLLSSPLSDFIAWTSRTRWWRLALLNKRSETPIHSGSPKEANTSPSNVSRGKTLAGSCKIVHLRITLETHMADHLFIRKLMLSFG